MTKHTQGPWQFNPERGDITSLSVKKEDSRTAQSSEECWNYYGGEVVAETVCSVDGPLLASAPELLEALFMAYDSARLFNRDGDSVWDERKKFILAAIAKATGGPSNADTPSGS